MAELRNPFYWYQVTLTANQHDKLSQVQEMMESIARAHDYGVHLTMSHKVGQMWDFMRLKDK